MKVLFPGVVPIPGPPANTPLTHLIHRTSRRHSVTYIQLTCPRSAAGWLNRVLNRICEALEVDQSGFYRDTRPAAYVGRGINAPNKPRNKAASGQLAAKASLIRLAVSLIRTAIFSNRSR